MPDSFKALRKEARRLKTPIEGLDEPNLEKLLLWRSINIHQAGSAMQQRFRTNSFRRLTVPNVTTRTADEAIRNLCRALGLRDNGNINVILRRVQAYRDNNNFNLEWATPAEIAQTNAQRPPPPEAALQADAPRGPRKRAAYELVVRPSKRQRTAATAASAAISAMWAAAATGEVQQTTEETASVARPDTRRQLVLTLPLNASKASQRAEASTSTGPRSGPRPTNAKGPKKVEELEQIAQPRLDKLLESKARSSSSAKGKRKPATKKKQQQGKQTTELASGGPAAGTKVIFLQIEAADAAGTNMQFANHIMFGSTPNVPHSELYHALTRQARGRAVRHGQEKDVFVWHFLVAHTADVDILEARERAEVRVPPGRAVGCLVRKKKATTISETEAKDWVAPEADKQKKKPEGGPEMPEGVRVNSALRRHQVDKFTNEASWLEPVGLNDFF
ncbi:hypothetical protein GGR56DRAFT_602399 [Xylariaceae sp. FL0804]|nr:hypothetical protein GGR56DRAFT_602399 [Xylariaceae sp. FL0804]